MDKIKIIIYGCGVMGRKIALSFFDKKGFEVMIKYLEKDMLET